MKKFLKKHDYLTTVKLTETQRVECVLANKDQIFYDIYKTGFKKTFYKNKKLKQTKTYKCYAHATRPLLLTDIFKHCLDIKYSVSLIEYLINGNTTTYKQFLSHIDIAKNRYEHEEDDLTTYIYQLFMSTKSRKRFIKQEKVITSKVLRQILSIITGQE